MIRWLGCAALAVLVIGLVVRAEKEKEKEKTTDGKAAKAFADLQSEFDKEFKAADTDEAKRKAVFKKFSPKYLDHAKKNATDDSAVLALEAVLQMNSVTEKAKVRQEAIDLLKKEYVKSKQIRPILRTLAILGGGVGSDPAALAIVKAVAKDNPDKLTRAAALDELANSLEFWAVVAGGLARNEKLRTSYEERDGERAVTKFLDSADDAKKEVVVLRKTLKADYSDVIASNDDDDRPTGGGLRVGTKAPETVCVDIDNKPVKLSELAGNVVVLDFWATWCGPCRAMIPHTRELVKHNEKKPLVFISVSCDTKRETLVDFTSKTEMPWTHWWDGRGGKVASAYGVRAFPTIYVVDHKGIIRFSSVGFDKDLDSVVAKLVKEAEAAKKKD